MPCKLDAKVDKKINSNEKKQKRIMLLGANRYHLPVIQAAHEL